MVYSECDEKHFDVEELQKECVLSDRNSEQSFFILLASNFPQCCLNCTLPFQRDIWVVNFFTKKDNVVLSFPDFCKWFWAFHPKNFCPLFGNSLGYVQSNLFEKIQFFGKYKLISIFARWAKTFRIFGKISSEGYSTLLSRRPEEQFTEPWFRWKMHYFHVFFGSWTKTNRFFPKNSAGFSNKRSACPEQHSEDYQFFGKETFFSNFLVFVWKPNWLWLKCLTNVVKIAFYEARAKFWFVFFWKKI